MHLRSLQKFSKKRSVLHFGILKFLYRLRKHLASFSLSSNPFRRLSLSFTLDLRLIYM